LRAPASSSVAGRYRVVSHVWMPRIANSPIASTAIARRIAPGEIVT